MTTKLNHLHTIEEVVHVLQITIILNPTTKQQQIDNKLSNVLLLIKTETLILPTILQEVQVVALELAEALAVEIWVVQAEALAAVAEVVEDEGKPNIKLNRLY